MKRSALLTSVAVLFFLFMFSCDDSPSDPGFNGNGTDNGDPTPNLVEMVGQSFSPGNLEVEVGTTVTWNNESSEIHTVTSGSNRDHDGLFDSGNVAPGESFQYTFNEAGTYDYYCVPHPGMDGRITVVDSS